jgi:hypothetical protein
VTGSIAPTASFSPWQIGRKTKKADVVEHPEVFRHVGLLFNKPPGLAGLLFIQSSDVCMVYSTARIAKHNCNSILLLRLIQVRRILQPDRYRFLVSRKLADSPPE